MTETRMQFWHRRGRELHAMRKSELCALYRQLGGLGGSTPPEKWTTAEVVNSVADMEWRRLPDDQKQPAEQLMSPPCDTCGKGEGAAAHRYGGSHHYAYTHRPDREWVPYYEHCTTCGRPIEHHDAYDLGHQYQAPAEEQPAPPAGATTEQQTEATPTPLHTDGPGCYPINPPPIPGRNPGMSG